MTIIMQVQTTTTTTTWSFQDISAGLLAAASAPATPAAHVRPSAHPLFDAVSALRSIARKNPRSPLRVYGVRVHLFRLERVVRQARERGQDLEGSSALSVVRRITDASLRAAVCSICLGELSRAQLHAGIVLPRAPAVVVPVLLSSVQDVSRAFTQALLHPSALYVDLQSVNDTQMLTLLFASFSDEHVLSILAPGDGDGDGGTDGGGRHLDAALVRLCKNTHFNDAFASFVASQIVRRARSTHRALAPPVAALTLAVQRRRVQLLKSLFSLFRITHPDALCLEDGDGDSLLLTAVCTARNDSAVQFLLQAGADPECLIKNHTDTVLRSALLNLCFHYADWPSDDALRASDMRTLHLIASAMTRDAIASHLAMPFSAGATVGVVLRYAPFTDPGVFREVAEQMNVPEAFLAAFQANVRY